MIGERRQAPRYPLIAAVGLEAGEGMTRDVSASGVFFVTEEGFAVGEAIGFHLVFEEPLQGPAQRIRCEGRVVRVEPCDGRWGVAVSLNSVQFGSQRLEQQKAPRGAQQVARSS